MIQQLWSKSVLAIAIATLSTTPLLAQTANFEGLSLATGFRRASASGNTGGSVSLSTIANTDRYNNFCIGYGGTNPDHIIELQNNFPSLRFRVNTPNEATLVIQGPDGMRCVTSTTMNPNTVLEDTNWPSGSYRVWVGSKDAGDRFRYNLVVQER
ncbi:MULTISPECIES: hypothetical protein [Desertifilum]|uniref:Peptidase S1 n=1 Tax=Desertifilum tharense IPPAS B-1220 TaxID=1781255 RepID=A0A1E5QNU8_9CYAN|nr:MULTISPECIES: hypothetical protein [Desertifilum]MDA0209382.1 hypothetical protein [Cyanobacteria bacterium FC1]OEJ76345.1 hypothetical protein BH720_04885 [Desertifilum tharense IPPAS B-1220]